MKLGPATQLGIQRQATRHSEEGAAGQVMGPALPLRLPRPRTVPSLNIGPTLKQCPRTTLTLSDKDFSGSGLAWPPGP